LKSTLGSDEVAEVFLSKLRESLKRETISTIENEQKSQDTSSSLNTIISPIMNVVSPSPSSSSPLPSISTIITKTTSPIPSSSSSPQPPSTPTVNNKRKSSNPTTNPNRFDGTTEEELTKRLLSDILQPNLDIVFVCYLIFILSSRISILFRWVLIPVCMLYIKVIIMVDREIIFGNYFICLI
jgi:hypothetical protein